MRTGGKSRGTKDTDPRVIRARRIVGLEFRDNWNRDDNATSRRKIRMDAPGMGVGTANTDYSSPSLLLYHPSVQKKITIFPLAAFFQSSSLPSVFNIESNPIEIVIQSIRNRESRRGAMVSRRQIGFERSWNFENGERERERGEHRSTGMRDKTLLYPRSYRVREFICPSRFFTTCLTCLIYFRNRTI